MDIVAGPAPRRIATSIDAPAPGTKKGRTERPAVSL